MPHRLALAWTTPRPRRRRRRSKSARRQLGALTDATFRVERYVFDSAYPPLVRIEGPVGALRDLLRAEAGSGAETRFRLLGLVEVFEVRGDDGTFSTVTDLLTHGAAHERAYTFI